MHRSPLTVLFLAALLLGGCSSARTAPQAPPPRAQVAAAPRPAPPVVPNPAPVAVRSVASGRGSALPERNLPLEQVLDRSRATNRPGVLYFCASWCGFCRKMNRETLSRPEVQAHLAGHFVAVEYDVDTPLGRELATRYGAHGFPTMVVVDGGGKATRTIVGARPAAELIALLGSSAP